MIQLLALLAGWPARIGVIVSAVAALVALRAWDVSTQQAKGAEKAVAKIEKATKDGLKKADSAARKSADPSAPGLRNPYYRD